MCWMRFVGALLTSLATAAAAGAAPYDLEQRLPDREYPAAAQKPAAAVGTVLLNPSFEINGGAGSTTIAGWTLFNENLSDGSFFAQSGIVSPLNGFAVPTPVNGLFAAMSDQTGPGLRIIYQDVTLPPGPATLSCDYFISSQANYAVQDPETLDPDNGQANQHARIDIMDPDAPVDDVGAGVLQNILLTRPGDPGDPSNPMLGYTTFTATIDGGRAVRVRFAEVDNQLFFNFGIDNCSLLAEVSTAAPALGSNALLTAAVILLGIGVLAVRRRERVSSAPGRPA